MVESRFQTSLLSEFSADYVNSVFDLLLQSSNCCLHIYKEFLTKEILHIQSDGFVLSAGGQNSGHSMFCSQAGLCMQMKVCLNLKPQFRLQSKLRLLRLLFSRQFLPDLCSTCTHVEFNKSPYLQKRVMQMFYICYLSLIPNFPLTRGRVCVQAKDHLWPAHMSTFKFNSSNILLVSL